MSNIANKKGLYNNFSGTIRYDATKCLVRNAIFEILSGYKSFKGNVAVLIKFQDGVIVDGKLYNADVNHCDFRGGELSRSIFRNGTFRGGLIERSCWHGGVWLKGTWGANNRDKFGRDRLLPPLFDGVESSNFSITEVGRYKNFTGWVTSAHSDFHIKDGDLELANKRGYNITIDCGTITDGVLDDAIINYVVFNGKKVNCCYWKDGLFNGFFLKAVIGMVAFGGVVFGMAAFGGVVFGRVVIGLVVMISMALGMILVILLISGIYRGLIL